MNYSTLILMLFLFLSTDHLFGQEYAEFTTDTTRFAQWSNETSTGVPEEVSHQEWYINGQRMSYGSGSIRVKVNKNQLDTLIYKGYRQRKLDTIICNIREPKKYTFFYNDCCGAFNIQDDESKRFVSGSIQFEVKNKSRKTRYIGTLGEIGLLIDSSTTDTLHVGCRSAMSPNVYTVSLHQIEVDQDSIKNTEITCLQVKNEDHPIWDYTYKIVKKQVHFLYLPLSNDPLLIRYDEYTDSLSIE